MTRLKPCTKADARALAGYAAAYLDIAKRVRDEGVAGADHVATGNAVLAAIAAADAICCAQLGERSRGTDYRDAVRLLRSIRHERDPQWAEQLADALMRALDSKDAAHYGVAGIARDAQVRAVRAAEILVAAAREVA